MFKVFCQNRFVLLRVLFLCSLFHFIDAVPVPPATVRDVIPSGPDGVLSPLQRWRDAVGTATQPWQRGRAMMLSIIHSVRSGPLSEVYKSSLSTASSSPCKPEQGKKCEVGIDGFGTAGEVQYEFESAKRNNKGRSTQVMVGCQCLSVECDIAILIRPVNVFRTLPGGNLQDTGKRTCIYEAVNGKFSDCHGELLRVSVRGEKERPKYTRGEGKFDYAVVESLSERWNATGQRGWTRDCLDTDIAALPVINTSRLAKDDIDFNVHRTQPKGPHCTPPENVQYYRSEEEADGEDCGKVYEYAASAAAHMASQGDEIAVGNLESSHLTKKPPLVSNTELTLVCSAAALGILVLWTMYRKQISSKHTSIGRLGFCVLGQVFSYVLEALPLHSALTSEFSAMRWSSIFAFADGTLALAKDQISGQGTAKGSVLILTSLVGEVQYRDTREIIVVILALLFDVLALGIIAATITFKLWFIRSHRRKRMTEEFPGE